MNTHVTQPWMFIADTLTRSLVNVAGSDSANVTTLRSSISKQNFLPRLYLPRTQTSTHNHHQRRQRGKFQRQKQKIQVILR